MAGAPSQADLEFDHADGGKIFVKNGQGKVQDKPLSTSLSDIKYLGRVQPDSTLAPYFILSAKPCTDCLEDRAVYFMRADGAKTIRMVQPGRILDPSTGIVVWEGRAFFGKCLADEPDAAYVVVQRDWVEKKKGKGRRKRRIKAMEYSIVMEIPAPGSDVVHEKMQELKSQKAYVSRQHRIADRVRAKQCTEVESRNRSMASKKIINLRRDDQDDADPDDENTTETASASGATPESKTPDGEKLANTSATEPAPAVSSAPSKPESPSNKVKENEKAKDDSAASTKPTGKN